VLDDAARLQVLAELGTAEPGDPADVLHAVAQLAAHICGTSMAAVSLLGETEQMFVGAVGLAVDRTDRASSFCAVAMQTPDVAMVVPDTHTDSRFAANRLVTGDPHIRSYAGVPLIAMEGVPVGAVCALGEQPMALSPAQLSALRALAVVTEQLLHARRTTTHLQSTLVELTAAQRAEQASREQFRTVFDHATTAMTIVDEHGRHLSVNAAFAALVGYSVDELCDRDMPDVTAAGDEGVDLTALSDLVDGSRRAALREKTYRHRDGRLVPALVSTSLIRPEADGPWLLLNHVESLEDRRAAEARLVEVHSAVDGIISIDERGRVVAWNLGAERLLGYSAAEMRGTELDRIIPAHARAAHRAGVARVAGGGAPRLVGEAVEVPVVHADGHELLAQLSLSSWSYDGRPHFTAILRDITEQRRSQVQAALVRHAAVTANSADTFGAAATTVVREVCEQLGWLAGQAWTTEPEPAAWYVAEHPHAEPGCRLRELAAHGDLPTDQQVPFDVGTRVATTDAELSGLGAAASQCAIGAAVAVPVLAGGDVAGMLAFYLPTGVPAPPPDLLTTLEQIGLTLGRVVERQRTAAELTRQANRDPVTGLVNRRMLLEHISATQQRLAAQPGRSSAVLLVNLDRFRLINDSLGYVSGDQVLRQVADRLRSAVADGDLVARLSADEFVVVAHRDSAAGGLDCAALAQQVLDALHEPVHVVGHPLPLRASIGICPITAAHAANSHYPAGVLRDADAALRQAKRRGRDQIQVFDSAMRGRAAERVTDETDLARAIVDDQLLLHYQPIVALDSGRPVGAEALVRWARPGRGMVPPDAFIALAEESGLIVDLGRWVLRQACRDAARWPDMLPPMAQESVSVNVSTRQLVHPRFLHDLDTAVADAGLPPHRLVLEITETALIEDPDAVMATLHAIRERGVRLALDDFGTGYSSLSYVQDLPVTILKIDKSFVDPITGPISGTALCEVVVKLADATGLISVAEGIETAEQAAALRQLGCHRGQGYAWSRPVPHDDLPAVVAAMAYGEPGIADLTRR
jgi:diguanylate cyclase (GGDEF)-like protein/PAS domain S-box-containing protein